MRRQFRHRGLLLVGLGRGRVQVWVSDTESSVIHVHSVEATDLWEALTGDGAYWLCSFRWATSPEDVHRRSLGVVSDRYGSYVHSTAGVDPYDQEVRVGLRDTPERAAAVEFLLQEINL